MNILIGKVGKSIKFKNLSIRTGDDAPVVFYSTLSRMYPENNYYFIGPNELSKLTQEEYDFVFPNHNVFDLFERDTENDPHYYDTMVQKMIDSGIHFDFALLFHGLSGTTNIPNYLTKGRVKGGEPVKQLECFSKYTGSYNLVLNKLGIPHYSMAEDVRYVTHESGDLYNREKLVFSQINATYTSRNHIKSEDDWTQVKTSTKCVYAGLEKIMLMAIDKNWPNNVDWKRKFECNDPSKHMIVMTNGYGIKNCKPDAHHNDKDARLPEHEKYILNGLKGSPYENTMIYGKWSEDVDKKWPGRFADIPLIELGDKIADARYTFVYSMSPGFVTVKPWEMIVKGLIPFIHPDYDRARIQGLPEFCYVKSPKDLLEKMTVLDNDIDKYKSVARECLRAVKKSYRDGSEVINFIMKTIYENEGWEWTEHDGVEPIMNHFDKDILKFK